MPTDNPLVDPARRQQIADSLTVESRHELYLHMRDALRYIETLEGQLAECYRLTGADPDGNEDWRLAREAVAEVRRLREESDAESKAADARIETLEQARDELRDRFQRAIDGGFDMRQRAERAEALVREAAEAAWTEASPGGYSKHFEQWWQASAVKRRLEGGEQGLTTDGKVI